MVIYLLVFATLIASAIQGFSDDPADKADA